MGRSSNDDRSDSKNPNNDAYWASESNRENQTGSSDDDDSPSPAYTGYGSHYSASVVPASRPRVVDVEFIVPPLPVRVQGLRLLIVSKGAKQKRIKVDAGSIDEAVDDAKTLWDRNALAYLALYNKETIYLEKSQTEPLGPDAVQSVATLAELEKLITFATNRTSSYRRSLQGDFGARYGEHALGQQLQAYGSCYAALQALRAEKLETVEALRAIGYNVTEETAAEFGLAGSVAQEVKDSAQWVRDFQSGKKQLDPVTDAFSRPEPILAIKL